MKYMIIDIGSNTVKYDVYSVKNGVFSLKAHDSFALRLISEIRDGILSNIGFEKLCTLLSDYQNAAKAMEIKAERVFAFATASLRRLKDPASVLSRIRHLTGLDVRLLSGEEEAECSFDGMMMTVKDPPMRGVMLDMGGGSTELTFFENGRPVWMHSCPFGALSLRELFAVKEQLPLEQEKELRSYVRRMLPSKLPEGFEALEEAVLVGGTARVCAKLAKALLVIKVKKGIDLKDFSALQKILAHPSDVQSTLINDRCPDRYMLMSSGVTAFAEIFEVLGVTKVRFCGGGVREGYLKRITQIDGLKEK